MAIFTRFGSEVDVLGGDIEKGEINTRRKEDGAIRQHYIADYVADNGLCEIEDAIEAANAKKRYSSSFGELRSAG